MHYSKVCLITDSTLHPLFAHFIEHDVAIVLPPGEACKSLESASSIWQQMARARMDRSSCVVALGGGALLDVAGFAAACYLRGIDTVYIPTTLLAMCDASIGGKTAVNLGPYKNIIGAFHNPTNIIIDPSYLDHDKHWHLGLSEVVKHALLEPSLFTFLLQHQGNIRSVLREVIDRSADVKKKIVDQDPHDRLGKRILLNIGHTIGHALEAVLGMSHAEAVSIGIVAENPHLQEVRSLLRSWDLPTDMPKVDPASLLEALAWDKKRVKDKLMLPRVHAVGQIEVLALSAEELIREVVYG